MNSVEEYGHYLFGKGYDAQMRAEARLLDRAGCTVADAAEAENALDNAYHVNDFWGFFRTVVLRNAARKMVLLEEALAEDKRA